ncbi:Uncharacterized protein Rs2_05662 [Raphanus sativus]|nr:Uncharacterized protein Rs2_05662 [Raphanus sativus]
MEVATRGFRLAREWNFAQEKKGKSTVILPAISRSMMDQLEATPFKTCKSDAAFDNTSKRVGLAWIFTDSTGTKIGQGSTAQDSIGSPLIAEALALRSAILSAVDREITHLKLFSDNKTLIRTISNDTQVSEIFGIVKDIQQMTSAFVAITFSHISRLHNCDADFLAKQTFHLSLKLPFLSRSSSTKGQADTATKCSISRSLSQRGASVTRKCRNVAKEHMSRFYILKRCVSMLVCWHKHA